MRWSDDELFEALGRYEQVCIDAHMKTNAINSYRDYAGRFLRWRTGDYWPRGASGPARRPTRPMVTTAELADDAKAYARVVDGAGREQATIDTYYRHAMFFVRWLDGTFMPGASVAGRRA